ncbi:arginine--tRNA ligase [Fictibacillus phosphorivorans]|uniref:arginine--tRNA ligase n=1 Tax=Fictibacillus phosphorivorans TaxID=1221500 RepID=UPI00203EA4DF|nr:arginine--tRNA ligase [Fictibacillus phosphorivorans]MCM3719313.1 arginine--tRNA ligase [Fictibacillus phosphorivorans]MCM3776934.1 arginine--tRNA ligase [Fictibacillus phosphorivorans]
MNEKKEFSAYLKSQIGEDLSLEQIELFIEKPKQLQQGDLAFPCFQLGKIFKTSPVEIAKRLSVGDGLPQLFYKIEATGAYVNVFIDKEVQGLKLLKTILKEKENYGSHSFGDGKTIVFDLSSPNIAKPFSMGHLRSTVIGSSLASISKKCGYETVKINYIGDWGTQFGKLIYAYLRWGVEEKVKENPIPELTKLYVRFHEEAEKDPAINDEGRKWFKKLEDGDPEATNLWIWFKEVSLKAFQKIYELLGIQFDSYNGEAFFNGKMDASVKELMEKGLLELSDGAQIVNVGEDMPPCLIKKTDGATLYATRDITAAIYRKNTYDFDQAFYVVGHEQSLHFEQVKRVLRKMDYTWADHMHHVPFGLILQNGKKMSTRKGRTVLLDTVLLDAIQLAENNIREKNPSLSEVEEVARQVGVGAVIFHDLKNEKGNDVEFSLEQMLKFEGDTGPYVQYTSARIQTLLNKGHYNGKLPDKLSIAEEGWELISVLNEFPSIVQQSFFRKEPSIISKYVLKLSHKFNHYYGSVKILNSDQTGERLALCASIQIVLKEGLQLLGIQTPKQM